MSDKKLMRPVEDRMIAGVAAGLANYFDVDPTIVRLIFLLLFLGGGHGFVIYLILWLIMPEAAGAAKAASFDPEEIVVGDS